ncbi:MAG: hypothetical protein JOY84_09380 [Curvibacter sp.]|nr:hypothetical protein [Curvibacter sp.]
MKTLATRPLLNWLLPHAMGLALGIALGVMSLWGAQAEESGAVPPPHHVRT